MARHEVKEAVKARLAERFTAITFADGRTVTIPVFGMNKEGATPPESGIFVQVQYPVANSIPVSLDGIVYREEGVIRLIVHEERGYGTDDGDRVARALSDIFTHKRFHGIQTFVASSPVEDDRSDNGLYFTMSVTVPYHYTYRGDGNLYG